MRHLFSIDKIPLSASAIGLAAIIFTGFVTFRPNRIAVGKPVFLWQTQDYLWIAVLVIWAALIIVSVLKISSRWHLFSISMLASILFLLLFITAGKHAALTAEEAGSIARTSLGPAFWMPLFALIIILTDTWQRSDKERDLIAIMVVVTGGIVIGLFVSGKLDMLSIMHEFTNRRERFFGEMLTHLALVVSSVGLALAFGMPLGLLAHRKKRLYNPTFFTLNTLQTIPSLALFGILIPVLAALTLKFPILADLGIKGIGTAPAIIALTVYSLLPVTRNTYIGFAAVDPAAIEAGTGMGMTRAQLLLRVEIPIASPIILNGIRVALVQAIGLTAVAALIGAGGLGVFIFQGLGQAANDLILLGAIPTIFIAVVVDFTMGGIVQLLQPEGLR
jgi:osmoprotectant transport system permease protein